MSNTTQVVEYAELHCTDFGSDKVYNLYLQRNPDETYTVAFAYGARGSRLNTGEKVSNVAFSQAKKTFDKFFREKTGKGYKVISSGTDQRGAPQVVQPAKVNGKTRSGFMPQPLSVASPAELATCLSDDDWSMQQKHDGERFTLLKESPSESFGSNKLGMAIPVPAELANDAAKMSGGTIIDGEFAKGKLYAFDLLMLNGVCLKGMGYAERHATLAKYVARMGFQSIVCVESITGVQPKRDMLERLKQELAEGVVFKLTYGIYKSGRTFDQYKHKFYDTASVIVTKKNAKRSVELAVLFNGERVSVGNVTIPPNFDLPSVGAIVEVRYLYYFGVGGSLFQPVYLGLRSDVLEAECDISQLKLKEGVALAA